MYLQTLMACLYRGWKPKLPQLQLQTLQLLADRSIQLRFINNLFLLYLFKYLLYISFRYFVSIIFPTRFYCYKQCITTQVCDKHIGRRKNLIKVNPVFSSQNFKCRSVQFCKIIGDPEDIGSDLHRRRVQSIDSVVMIYLNRDNVDALIQVN